MNVTALHWAPWIPSSRTQLFSEAAEGTKNPDQAILADYEAIRTRNRDQEATCDAE